MSSNSTLFNYSTSTIFGITNSNTSIVNYIEGNNYNGFKIFSVCFAIIISLFLLGVFIFIIKLFIIDECLYKSKSNNNNLIENINQSKKETQDNIYEIL